MPENLLLSSQSDPTMPLFVTKKRLSRLKNMSVGGVKTVLLVEYRDEVFARLAGDLGAMGIWVERARSGAEACCRFVRCSPQLAIANALMPYDSGWLLAAKLRLIRPTACIWLYAPPPRSSDYDHGLAHFLGVAELIHYQGDLFLLAKEIRSRLVGSPTEMQRAGREVAVGWPHVKTPACNSRWRSQFPVP